MTACFYTELIQCPTIPDPDSFPILSRMFTQDEIDAIVAARVAREHGLQPPPWIYAPFVYVYNPDDDHSVDSMCDCSDCQYDEDIADLSDFDSDCDIPDSDVEDDNPNPFEFADLEDPSN